VQTLIARNANVGTISVPQVGGAALQSVSLDFNCMNGRQDLPSRTFNLSSATSLRHFSCISCCVTQLAGVFLAPDSWGTPTLLEDINFANNNIYGIIPASWFDASLAESFGPTLPVSLKSLNLSGNTRLTGSLPTAGNGFQSLLSIDLSGTGIEGDLPPTWANFPALQLLDLSGTDVRCSLQLQEGQLRCDMSSHWVRQSGLSNEVLDASGTLLRGLHCPLLAVKRNGGPISLDDSFSQYALCECAAPCFGAAGVCVECPQGCSCSQGTISGCWPTVLPGVVASVTSAFSQGVEIVTPLRIAVLHPCPRLPNGTSLCGHPAGAAQWPLFFVAAGSDAEAAVPNLSDWCWPGHTGRWCAQCREGFFSSGRLCKRCLPTGLHVLIVAANVAALLAVVAYLAKQQSCTEQARKDLVAYLAEDDTAAAAQLSRSPSAVNRAGTDPSNDAAEVTRADPVQTSVPSNPLRVLLFHMQQLGLLMDSAAALPGSLSGLLTVFSSAGNGLSLSSLVALECLSSWTLAHRCWMALAAPAAVGVAALAAHAASCCQIRSRAVDPFAAAERRSSPPGSSLFEPQRVYSVCWSLLYLLVFPCATVALTALGCSERSEVAVDSSRVYLNLQPYQQCDAQWRREILPPALLAALFWCVLFPLCSTWALWRARRMVHRASGAAASSQLNIEHSMRDDEQLQPPSPVGGAARLHSTAGASSAWSLSREQLSPYRPSFWYYEQVLLARRLLLACVVSVVPSGSLYVPLLLLSLIQLAALLQHWAKPFRSEWLNRAELASLYLLLLNYIAAVVLQSGMVSGGTGGGGGRDSVSSTGTGGGGWAADGAGWLGVLLALNLAFLLALIGGLFAFVRHKATVHWPRICGALLNCLACLTCSSAEAVAAVKPASDPAEFGTAAEMREHKRGDLLFNSALELGEPLL